MNEEKIELRKEEDPKITFSVPGEEAFIVLEKGKFTYKGKTIDDIHQVYEAFCVFIIRAQDK